MVTLGSLAVEKTAIEFSATKTAWEDLERDWKEIIQIHNGGLPIHATGLMRADMDGKGAAVLQRCIDLLARLDLDLFHIFVCTVDLVDYERARIECRFLMTPRLDEQRPKPAEAICVDWCVGDLFDRLNIDTERPDETAVIDLIFDQNERFLNEIHRVRTSDWKRRPLWAKGLHAPSWTGRIRLPKCASSEDEWALQAADVIAWTTTRHYTVADHEAWFEALRERRKKDFQFYDYDTIIREYKDR